MENGCSTTVLNRDSIATSSTAGDRRGAKWTAWILQRGAGNSTFSGLGEKYQFPSISISAAAEENYEDADTILSFNTPEMGQFCEASKKAIYITCVKVTNRTVLKRVRVGRWTDVFGPDFRGSWRSLYKPPIVETCSWYHSYEQTRGTPEFSSG